MKKGIVKPVVFNGEDLGYWKNRTKNYLLSQGRVIWVMLKADTSKVVPLTCVN
jgi:hypothetical protein